MEKKDKKSNNIVDVVAGQKIKINNEQIILFLLLLAGFIWRGVFIYRDLDWLTNYWLFEDWGYSLKIAKNIAAGLGETCDRVVKTNGYQPLYVWLMAPVYLIFKNDIYTPIYIALTLLSLCNVLTGLYIYKIIRFFGVGKFWRYFAVGVWMFNLNIARSGTLGLESGLSVFLVSISIYYALRYKGSETTRPSLILGFLLGFSFLSRIDSVFLIASVYLYLIVFQIETLASDVKVLLFLKFDAMTKNFRQLLIVSIPVLVILGSYMIYNKLFFGYVLPTSGLVVGHKKSLFSFLINMNWHYVFYSVYIISAMLAGNMTVNGFRYYDEYWGVFSILSSAFFIEALVCFFMFSLKNKIQFLKKYLLVFLVGASFFFGYTFYLFMAFERYFLPIILVILILLATLLSRIDSFLKTKNKLLSEIFAVSTVILLLTVYYIGAIPHFTSSLTYTAGWKKGVEQLNTIAKDGDVVGAFQAGNLGYFYTKGRAVNLDGVVNFAAYEARESKELFDYLRENKIKYFADESDWVFAPLPFFQSDAEIKSFISSLEQVFNTTEYSFNIYRYVDNGYTNIINIDEHNSNWIVRQDHRMLDGDIAYQQVQGAFFEFSSSNSFDIKMLRHDWSGIMNLYIDGELEETIDLYSTAANPTYKYRYNNFSGQVHNVRLEVDSEKNPRSNGYQVWVDAILELGMKRINFGDPPDDWSMNGSWQKKSHDFMYKHDMVMSWNEGDSIDFSSGTNFKIKFLKHDWSGIVNIYQDDELIDQIDLYAEQQDNNFYYSFADSDGENHRYKLEVSNQKNPDSHSNQVWVDVLVQTK